MEHIQKPPHINPRDQWHVDNFFQYANNLCNDAHTEGREDILEWLKKKIDPSSYCYRASDVYVKTATTEGNIKVIKWFAKKGCKLDGIPHQSNLIESINRDKLDVLEELLKQGADPNRKAYYRIKIQKKAKSFLGSPIDCALQKHTNPYDKKDMTKAATLLFAYDAQISHQDQSQGLSALILDKFFDAGDKYLQVLAGSKLLLQLKNIPTYQDSSIIIELSTLLTQAAIALDLNPEKITESIIGKKIDIEISKIREALDFASSKLKESNQELSVKALELVGYFQDEENKEKAKKHLEEASSALQKINPELSPEIEKILEKLQHHPEVHNDESLEEKMQIEGEVHLTNLEIEEMGQEAINT